MAMNLAMLMRLKGAAKEFQERHPKFISFLQYAAKHSMKEGNVLEISLRGPDDQQVKSNLRLTKEDVELFAQLQQILQNEG